MIARNTELSNTMKEREEEVRSDVANLKSQVAAGTELASAQIQKSVSDIPSKFVSAIYEDNI